MGLDTIIDILERDPPAPSAADFVKMLSIRKDAAVSIIGAGLKADENRFRRRHDDIMQRLFDLVKKDNKLVTIEQSQS